MNDLTLMAAGQVCSTEVEVSCSNKKAMSLATLSPAHGLVQPMEFFGNRDLGHSSNQREASKADANVNAVNKFLNLGHIAHLLLSE